MTKPTIAVLGLGYVGLPLAVAFGKQFETIGFDIDSDRISQLRHWDDRTLELSAEDLKSAKLLRFTDDEHELQAATVFIVTVPTPVDGHNLPDLTPLTSAMQTVGRHLRRGGTVVVESTVYPGVTEDVCAPILETESGLTLNLDFSVGYSPERINPGDKSHTLETICKVVSGSNQPAANLINGLYSSITTAGTFLAPSIRVAEAAKVIENTQRDVNIALVNELAMLFGKLELDTHDVLAAAGTKWNFLNFMPGLVGGHCIGVDPYYLTYKAEEVGHHPEVILAGRRINDRMGGYVADRLVLELVRRRVDINDACVLILGLAFKENCPDIRNTRVVDIVARLGEFGIHCAVTDPWVDPVEAKRAYNLDVVPIPSALARSYAGAVLAVNHREFRDIGPDLRAATNGVIFDLKGALPREISDIRL